MPGGYVSKTRYMSLYPVSIGLLCLYVDRPASLSGKASGRQTDCQDSLVCMYIHNNGKNKDAVQYFSLCRHVKEFWNERNFTYISLR